MIHHLNTGVHVLVLNMILFLSEVFIIHVHVVIIHVVIIHVVIIHVVIIHVVIIHVHVVTIHVLHKCIYIVSENEITCQANPRVWVLSVRV